MPANLVNPDLKKERDKASFNTQEFTDWWVGGKDKYAAKKKLGKCKHGKFVDIFYLCTYRHVLCNYALLLNNFISVT